MQENIVLECFLTARGKKAAYVFSSDELRNAVAFSSPTIICREPVSRSLAFHWPPNIILESPAKSFDYTQFVFITIQEWKGWGITILLYFTILLAHALHYRQRAAYCCWYPAFWVASPGPESGVPRNWAPSTLSTLWKSRISEYIMTRKKKHTWERLNNFQTKLPVYTYLSTCQREGLPRWMTSQIFPVLRVHLMDHGKEQGMDEQELQLQ